jgi:hypothetical protein
MRSVCTFVAFTFVATLSAGARAQEAPPPLLDGAPEPPVAAPDDPQAPPDAPRPLETPDDVPPADATPAPKKAKKPAPDQKPAEEDGESRAEDLIAAAVAGAAGGVLALGLDAVGFVLITQQNANGNNPYVVPELLAFAIGVPLLSTAVAVTLAWIIGGYDAGLGSLFGGLIGLGIGGGGGGAVGAIAGFVVALPIALLIAVCSPDAATALLLIGAAVGGGIGLHVGGTAGGVIGASVGALGGEVVDTEAPDAEEHTGAMAY